MRLEDFRIKIFADGADKASILDLAKKSYIQGFTTNPTLMQKAGVTDYEGFAKDILSVIKDRPISFEVFSDDLNEMERQARLIASWGENVYVKIPITNTKKESTVPLIRRLVAEGVKLNVTAILTLEQVRDVSTALSLRVPSIVSVFAGRIADTGRDPLPLMREAKAILSFNSQAELLWASCRELYNIVQAEEMGCQIVTVTPDILKKLEKLGTDLDELSLDTVKMFYNDGQKAGFKLKVSHAGYIRSYLDEVKKITDLIDRDKVETFIHALADLRERKGRLFIIGIGGSAANASHAVNDFRKIAKIETYAPTDNVAELTAWTNDNGFEFIFKNWLITSRLNNNDMLMVLSVGGGSATTSRNIVLALEYAQSVGATSLGIVSRDGGMTVKLAQHVLLVPVVSADRTTPHAEEWQGILWHLIVNALQL